MPRQYPDPGELQEIKRAIKMDKLHSTMCYYHLNNLRENSAIFGPSLYSHGGREDNVGFTSCCHKVQRQEERPSTTSGLCS